MPGRRSSSVALKLSVALLLLPLLLLSSCSSFKKILPLEIRTVEVERKIPVQNRPRPVKLSNLHFYVVTEDTFAAFKQRFVKQNGDFLFYAISVRDYETLALNMAEKDNCAVGRIRKDCAMKNGLSFWVVGDQILKGAALNAVQIAELAAKD